MHTHGGSIVFWDSYAMRNGGQSFVQMETQPCLNRLGQ